MSARKAGPAKAVGFDRQSLILVQSAERGLGEEKADRPRTVLQKWCFEESGLISQEADWAEEFPDYKEPQKNLALNAS